MRNAWGWFLAQGDRLWTISEKIQAGDREGSGHRFFRDIKERTFGNSRGQLKSKWDFQGCS